MKYKVKDYFMMRDVVGDHVVIARGPAAIEFNGVLILNESCAFLWEQLQNYMDVQEMANILSEKYSIEMERAIGDVQKCVSKMLEYELLDMKE